MREIVVLTRGITSLAFGSCCKLPTRQNNNLETAYRHQFFIPKLTMADTDEVLNVSTSMDTIRSNLREHRKIERFKVRNESTDAFRVGIGVIKEIISDLDNITEKDVTGMASRIKKRKGATEEDLNRLSHAFLQNVENIVTFSKITGALNVVVKELTGNDSKRRILACECLCNFSLGNDVCCEKLALSAGSYLILFLENTHQRLAITSAWTISNVLLSDNNEIITALLSQGLIPKLVSIFRSKSSQTELLTESVKCLYILLSKHRNSLRSEDKILLPPIITDFINMDHPFGLKVAYHALFISDFQQTQENYHNIMMKCVWFLCNFKKNGSTMNTLDEKLTVAMVLRIVGNLIALESCGQELLQKFIQLLALENESFSTIINGIIKIDSVYKNELLWIAGNIYQGNENFRDEIVSTLMMFK